MVNLLTLTLSATPTYDPSPATHSECGYGRPQLLSSQKLTLVIVDIKSTQFAPTSCFHTKKKHISWDHLFWHIFPLENDHKHLFSGRNQMTAMYLQIFDRPATTASPSWKYPSEITSSWGMDDWNTIVSFWDGNYFQGRTVSFRGVYIKITSTSKACTARLSASSSLSLWTLSSSNVAFLKLPFLMPAANLAFYKSSKYFEPLDVGKLRTTLSTDLGKNTNGCTEASHLARHAEPQGPKERSGPAVALAPKKMDDWNLVNFGLKVWFLWSQIINDVPKSCYIIILIYECFLKWWYSQIIHFSRVSIINHPFRGYP